MSVSLSALRTGRTLLSRNIISYWNESPGNEITGYGLDLSQSGLPTVTGSDIYFDAAFSFNNTRVPWKYSKVCAHTSDRSLSYRHAAVSHRRAHSLCRTYGCLSNDLEVPNKNLEGLKSVRPVSQFKLKGLSLEKIQTHKSLNLRTLITMYEIEVLWKLLNRSTIDSVMKTWKTYECWMSYIMSYSYVIIRVKWFGNSDYTMYRGCLHNKDLEIT
jgi:hypothetical protein